MPLDHLITSRITLFSITIYGGKLTLAGWLFQNQCITQGEVTT